ncbi:MAG: 3-hydroxyacyl-CoA dehydrogenase family protein [Deltaproteobacteria bacterium]|nr:3-hydroxyacyl-CoA dehydrogenase family protein [Deltaproteobacteria bacterium]MBW2015343.1 3-hydroxyacyl-CoA dehydrogenase family protein [Deltaproteobacteria bacterium]MBW2128204.1 3-hydroxyacyl-CoA dehydrogenase family protein [Deltaproteobacteria bacterium]MBW2303079.1 3-hydroxyacyl-CoA dehydrogenase family protein [Deltaproteobacteria bacterium]
MEIKKIGVVGAGTMGNGIAQVAAQNGYDVIMRDIKDEFVERGLKNIEKFLTKSVEKGKIEASEKDAVLSRIKGTTDMNDLKDSDLVVEVVIEDLELKKKVFKELDELCRPEVILASNTSSMSITEIAAATNRPEKVCGMHFFNPVPLMKLVEIIRGVATSDETIAVCTELAQKMGKITVEVKKDSPGFIVNRCMIPHMIEAIRIVEEGVASIEDVDTAVKNGLNYPMGPFELMDLTGIDIAYFVTEYFFKELNKELKWAAPTLMKNMIRANKLGRKTGAGWYDYGK